MITSIIIITIISITMIIICIIIITIIIISVAISSIIIIITTIVSIIMIMPALNPAHDFLRTGTKSSYRVRSHALSNRQTGF